MGPDACTRVFSLSWLSPAGRQHIVEYPGWEDSKEENPSIWHSASLPLASWPSSQVAPCRLLCTELRTSPPPPAAERFP